MKTITIAFAAALSIAALGCKKSGADCDKAIDHSMEMSKADMQKMPGMDDKIMHKLKDIGVQHCKDDKWSAEITKCMVDAKTETDGQACYSKLSPEQQKKMNDAMMQTMMASMPPPTPTAAPATGSAATGSAAPESATGSAMAGSAMGSAAMGSAEAGSAKKK
jgi:hypothetical protein